MNDVIIYVTEVSSIATKKQKPQLTQNSNGNVRKAVLLRLLFKFQLLPFISLHYDSFLVTNCTPSIYLGNSLV